MTTAPRSASTARSEWALGCTFSVVPVGSAIAATHWWRDGSHVRLYYQNSQNDIIEWCYDTGSSWFAGHTFTQVAPGTGIAAVGWDGAANHVRVFYKDAAPYEGSYHPSSSSATTAVNGAQARSSPGRAKPR